MKTILGIDSGSKTIGYGFLGIEEDKVQLIEHGNIKTLDKDKHSIVERLDHISKQIELLCEKLKPDHVLIEDIIQFMQKRTTANTIITLAVFNRVISLQVYRSTGKIPIYLLPISIRTRIKKIFNLEKTPEKEEIPNLLQNYFGKTFFKIVGYKKRGKNAGQPIISTYDEADAVAAGLAGLFELGLLKE